MTTPFSDSHLYPICVEDLLGFIDAAGRVVIPPQFRNWSRFSEGLARVTLPAMDEDAEFFEFYESGFIDQHGKFVLGPGTPRGFVAPEQTYTHYSYGDFHEGLATFWVGSITGCGGYINRAGELVIPPKFARVDCFSEGLACVSLPRSDGSPIGPKRTGFINPAGDFVIRPTRSFVASGFSEGLCIIDTCDEEGNWHPSVIDRQGKLVIPPGIYTGIESFARGLARVAKNGKVGCIDRQGNVVIPLEFDQLAGFEHGEFTTGKRQGKHWIVDRAGKCVTEFSLDGKLEVGRLCSGFSRVRSQDRVGYANMAGELVIPLEFDNGEDFRDQLAYVQQGDHKGYINQRGEFVWKTDRWERSCGNSLSEPLIQFLPPGTIEALPLEYERARTKNVIVFVSNDSLDLLQSWMTNVLGEQYRIRGNETEPWRLDIDISGDSFVGSFQAVDVADEEAEGFLSHLASTNLRQLIEKHQPVVAGILVHEF